MGFYNGMFPILSGKEEAGRAFAAEVAGPRQAEFRALQAKANVTRETWVLEENALGSFVLVWFEGDVEKAMTDLATDQSEFPTWFRAQVMEVTGFDLGAPPEGPPPEVLIDWHS